MVGQWSFVCTVTGAPWAPAPGTHVQEHTGELGSVPSGVNTAGPRQVNAGVPKLLHAETTAGVVPCAGAPVQRFWQSASVATFVSVTTRVSVPRTQVMAQPRAQINDGNAPPSRLNVSKKMDARRLKNDIIYYREVGAAKNFLIKNSNVLLSSAPWMRIPLKKKVGVPSTPARSPSAISPWIRSW